MNGVARNAGCKPPWFSWSAPDIDECETLQNFSKYKKHEDIYDYDLEFITKKTGCLKLCKFRQYLISLVYIRNWWIFGIICWIFFPLNLGLV